MPLGVVQSSDFDAELSRISDASRSNEKVQIIERGRGPKLATPQIMRELIAGEAIAGASAKEISEAFNISPSSISAYKHNATSTASYHSPDESLKKANDELRKDIGGRAQNKLRDALDAIVFPQDIKPQIAAAIARDMSSVIKNINPNPDVQINNQQVIVYKPRMREEESYEIIQVVD